MTPQEIQALVQKQAELTTRARRYFDIIYSMRQDWKDVFSYSPSVDNLYFTETSVEISCSAAACGRGCCGYDYHTYSFPVEYLSLEVSELMEGVQKELDALAEQKRLEDEREQAKEAEEARQAALAQEARERAEYARLQAKFEAP